MTSLKRLLLTTLLIANVTGAPAWAMTAPTTETTDGQANDQTQANIQQQDDPFFGHPGSKKRLYWYIGGGVVLVITATAIYYYYHDNQTPQQPSKPVGIVPQPTTTNSTDQAHTTPTTTPLPTPDQQTPIAQLNSNSEQTHPATQQAPTDDEDWGDFDTGAALSTIRQQAVFTSEDTQTLDKTLDAMTQQADNAELRWLKSRQFETVNLKRRHKPSSSLSTLPLPRSKH